MGAKRALIVDDSKSARLFLARILEKYEIGVDSAENAEAAIEYLATHRPDVIFMDHLMPGMDGFQAIEAIKNNPLTATIPILMYTSQEGELYLGQARALGAVGVLPKQIKPTDVSKVLYQLHLLADRRNAYQSSFRALNLPADALQGEPAAANDPAAATDAAAANDAGAGPRILTEAALRDQFADLRRALVTGIDTQTERIAAEIHALLLERLPPPPGGAPETAQLPPRAGAPTGLLVAAVACLFALGTLGLWWQQLGQMRSLTADMAQLRGEMRERALHAQPQAASAGSKAPPLPSALRAPPPDARAIVLGVPYGAEALGGPRLEVIRQLLDRLVRENHSGIVEIKSYPGRFCLVGNAVEGFSVAPDETPFAKCDLVGNPADDSLSPSQRTPLPFANLVGAVRSSSRGALDVQPSVGDVTVTVVPYPQISPELSAGEWNRAGSANNRIEIRVR